MNRLLRGLIRSAITSFSLVLSLVGKSYALPTPIPGTTVVIEPPPGFTLSENFSGLEHLESGSSLTINEFPADVYSQMAILFSNQEQARAGLLRQGIIVEEQTTLTMDDTDIPLIYGTQQSAIGTIEKYVTLLQGDNTVLLTFNIFDPSSVSREQVEAAIASIRLTSAPTLAEKVEQLPFAFESIAPFELREVIGGTSALLTTFEGTDPSGQLPMLIITKGQSPVYETNLATFSETLLLGTQGFSLANITHQRSTPFAGGEGYLIEAEQNGIKIIQYVSIGRDQRHLRLLATGPPLALDDIRDSVRTIANSVKNKEQL